MTRDFGSRGSELSSSGLVLGVVSVGVRINLVEEPWVVPKVQALVVVVNISCVKLGAFVNFIPLICQQLFKVVQRSCLVIVDNFQVVLELDQPVDV